MYEAARVDDPIYHTSALAGFLIGAIIGIAIIAVASFAFFTCGFLAGLILGFLADQIASGVLQLGEAIGRSIHSTVGKILTGSDNVSTNSRPAARAVLSTVVCEDHSPEIRIAQGSGNIYINSQPAARKDDHTECDAVIEDGSPNVFLGGGTQTVLEISPEIPDWLRQVVDVLFVVAGMLGGLAGAARQAATGRDGCLRGSDGFFQQPGGCHYRAKNSVAGDGFHPARTSARHLFALLCQPSGN